MYNGKFTLADLWLVIRDFTYFGFKKIKQRLWILWILIWYG